MTDNFAAKGYRVDSAMDGETAIEKALSDRPDLMVLDVMLPKVNGYEVCRYLRHRGEAFSRERIMDEVWGYGSRVTLRSVDRFVTSLRKVIEFH